MEAVFVQLVIIVVNAVNMLNPNSSIVLLTFFMLHIQKNANARGVSFINISLEIKITMHLFLALMQKIVEIPNEHFGIGSCFYDFISVPFDFCNLNYFSRCVCVLHKCTHSISKITQILMDARRCIGPIVKCSYCWL